MALSLHWPLSIQPVCLPLPEGLTVGDLDAQARASTFMYTRPLAVQEGAGRVEEKGWAARPQLLSRPRPCKCQLGVGALLTGHWRLGARVWRGSYQRKEMTPTGLWEKESGLVRGQRTSHQK